MFSPIGYIAQIFTLRYERNRLFDAMEELDRMASQQLTHGRDEVKPFAQEVFNVCELALETYRRPLQKDSP